MISISIHAPHTGRDEAAPGWDVWGNISIHAPHTGRDANGNTIYDGVEVFQSTRPIRGATPTSEPPAQPARYFNPRAPYGARLCINLALPNLVNISIHAPHTGRDRLRAVNKSGDPSFQSTRPIRGATFDYAGQSWILLEFQSTRPIRGATASHDCSCTTCANFNPRAPYGARLLSERFRLDAVQISIHAPHTGRDSAQEKKRIVMQKFQSTRPIRGATETCHGGDRS